MRKKKLILWTAAAGAAALAIGFVLKYEQPRPGAPVAAGPAKREAAAPQSSQYSALPQRDGLNRARGDLFGSNVPPPPPAPKRAKKEEAEEAQAPPAPVAPPNPYRVAGQVSRCDTESQVVLAREDRVYLVREGDALEGGYRVESIKPNGVTLVYTPMDLRQHLASASALQIEGALAAHAASANAAASASGGPTAQLRWEGPTRVSTGSEFEVALKITSDLPVRGSPLQLSYDAKVLEPVSVRAGDFFVDGSFTYRVNPTGSIFVGAFGKGEAAADAEFLVVTFKPIRAGTAELKLSSMVLQGPGGSAVGHQPLAAFRTSVGQ